MWLNAFNSSKGRLNVSQRVWQERRSDPELQRKLVSGLGIQPVTAAVLAHRGICSEEEGRRFLEPSSDDLIDPFLLPDMDRAVERIEKAIRNQERVVIYGDYDVDGMTATALYWEWFHRRGCPVGYYIPHRIREGYGLNAEAIRTLHAQETQLLITADCGTTSVSEIRLAHSLGMDVIVTDHHEAPSDRSEWPPAFALINPKRSDSKYPFDGLCTAGLAYKTMQALGSGMGREMLDLVALGTLADVSPVVGENRYLVSEGLRQLSLENRVGIKALKAAARMEGASVGCGTVGFVLAPRINAAGRLAEASNGVRLLTTRSHQEAQQIAASLEVWNQERQCIEQAVLSEAERQIAEDVDLPKARCVVLASRHWHLGVVGIVASRIVERYGRPTVLIALDGQGLGKGSARSIPGFHLHRGLSACADLLVRFGGHRQAAGLTIREEQIPAFRERLSAQVAAAVGEGDLFSTLTVDAAVELEDLTFSLIRELERLRPHGIGNPEPTLTVRDAIGMEPRVIGNNHLRFKVKKHGALTFEAIGYRMGELAGRLRHGQRLNLAFTPEVQTWQGEERAQLRIKDIQFVHCS